MTDTGKQKVKYWLLGIFTGGAVAAPVTAFITKRICDNKKEEEVRIASEKGFNDGMNQMAEYAVSVQNEAEASKIEQENKEEPEEQEEETPKSDDIYGVKAEVKLDEDGIPVEEDINNYDISIDDEEATEEARDRVEEHERYLDMTERYTRSGEISPRKISMEQFSVEHIFEKAYINWYDEDNIFENGLLPVSDPYYEFGVTDGRELFNHPENLEDPNVVYIRNESTTTDYEITRVNGAYSKLVGVLND